MDSEEIRRINRELRKTLKTSPSRKIALSRGVSESEHRDEIIAAFVSLPDSYFTEDNNPYNEEDFAMVNVRGEDYYLKMSYLEDLDSCTHGYNIFVMTIMHSSEY